MLKQMLQAIANKNVPWKVKISSPFRFAWAICRALVYKIKGNHFLADHDKERQRLAVCDSCFHNNYEVCLICGCQIELKTMIASEICPIGKWD